MSTRIMLKNVRLSYAHVWEPQPAREADREPKYATSIIIPKSDTAQIKKIEAAIDALLKAEGPAKFGGKVPPRGSLKLPLRDGDTERDDEAYQDAMFLNASSKTSSRSSTGTKSTPACTSTSRLSCTSSMSMATGVWPVGLGTSRRFATVKPWVAEPSRPKASSPLSMTARLTSSPDLYI